MLTVHGDTGSGNCLKVKWILDWLGHDYRWVETDIRMGASRTAEFLARNPWGQVPTVVLEDGRPLTQSNAILVHFGEGSALVPGDADQRARMFEWLFWEQNSHEPYVAGARFQRLYLGRSAAEVDAKMMERGAAALDRLEQAVGTSDFLTGETPTLADLSLVAYTRMADEGGFDLDAYPAIRRWIGRVEEALGIG